VAALRAFPILGIRTNMPYLLGILEHPRFREGTIDTGFLDSEGATLLSSSPQEIPEIVQAVMKTAGEPTVSAGGVRAAAENSWDPWARLQGWRNG
jgi:acetyl/propionyl-CoA carboxylase alpha subunit